MLFSSDFMRLSDKTFWFVGKARERVYVCLLPPAVEGFFFFVGGLLSNHWKLFILCFVQLFGPAMLW